MAPNASGRRSEPDRLDNLVFLAIWLGVIVLSMWLSPGEQSVSIGGYTLPPLCLWKALTGWRCPGCGLTRSFVFFGHGQWAEAFHMHWLGPALYLWMVADVIRRVRIALKPRSPHAPAGSTPPPPPGP